MTIKATILNRVTDYFVESNDFNGILASRLFNEHSVEEKPFREALAALVSAGKIAGAFNRWQENPHILRTKPPPVDRQRELIATEPLNAFALYPTADVLRLRPDLNEYETRPFARRLVLGEPQLTEAFFDLAVLDRYHRDPRYCFDFHDFGGSICIRDEPYLSEDVRNCEKIHLQTFGIAYDQRHRRVVVSFICYLARLSPEHQAFWMSQAITAPCSSNSDYANASIFGRWPEHYSAYAALLAEMVEINKIAVFMGRPPLFKRTWDRERPPGFHPMLRPTRRNLDEFVHLLDKMISENINRDFFEDEVPYEKETTRDDGMIEVTKINTVRILKTWLSKFYRCAEGTAMSHPLLNFKWRLSARGCKTPGAKKPQAALQGSRRRATNGTIQEESGKWERLSSEGQVR